jgi:hypothetical protein
MQNLKIQKSQKFNFNAHIHKLVSGVAHRDDETQHVHYTCIRNMIVFIYIYRKQILPVLEYASSDRKKDYMASAAEDPKRRESSMYI